MYFYLFEAPSAPRRLELSLKIKERIARLGISGETARPEPGRSIEQLVAGAIEKRYSTVVAVGGAELVNRTACALGGTGAAFGIIPTAAHADLADLIGTDAWEEAADLLKRRRVVPAPLGRMPDGSCFITPLRAELRDGTRLEVLTEEYAVRLGGGSLRLVPREGGLTLEHEPAERRPGGITRLLDRRKAPAAPLRSVLRSGNFSLNAGAQIPVTVAGEQVGMLPLTVFLFPERLNLIVGAGRKR